MRFTYDNNYFNARDQGIPEEGYTALAERLLAGIPVRLHTDFLRQRGELSALAETVVYTGAIGAYFDYRLGALEYRSLRFETEVLDTDNYQGNAVVNYTDAETPWTRIIEHKHFTFGAQPKTVITREYSAAWQPGDEPYYPLRHWRWPSRCSDPAGRHGNDRYPAGYHARSRFYAAKISALPVPI